MPNTPASFAKLFDLTNRRQVVAYRDPDAAEPTLVLLTTVGGTLATTRMTFNNPEAPLDSKRAAMAKVLDLIDEDKAHEVANHLEGTLQKHVPLLSFLGDLHEIAGRRQRPFAKLLLTESGEQVLCVREEDDDDRPILRAIAQTWSIAFPFPTAPARDETFENDVQLRALLSTDAHLGLLPEGSVARRRPKGP